MQKKEIIMTAVIAVTAIGIAVYFLRKQRDKRLINENEFTPQKGVASWEYTL